MTSFNDTIKNNLLTFQWDKIYNEIKDVDIDTLIDTDTKNKILAFKAMLSMHFWQSKEYSIKLLEKISNQINDPYTFFARMYTYLLMADKENIKKYSRLWPLNTPKWMLQ